MKLARWVHTTRRAPGRAHGRRIGSLDSPEAVDTSHQAAGRKPTYFSANATIDDIAEDLVGLMMAQGVPSRHLEHSLQFLAPLGIDERKLHSLLTEHSRIRGNEVFPLLDPEKAEGLESLTALLYQLGFSPREVGIALTQLPQLADMSTATMGLRILRCKALGMDGGQIIRLVSTAPVTMMWEDECMCPDTPVDLSMAPYVLLLLMARLLRLAATDLL